jgi:hypothetical protein
MSDSPICAWAGLDRYRVSEVEEEAARSRYGSCAPLIFQPATRRRQHSSMAGTRIEDDDRSSRAYLPGRVAHAVA